MQFENILGNKNKILQIRRMINSKKFPQNILLTGLDGIGKIEIGKVIAESLLCENPNDGDPCGKCESCRAFENDFTHSDFHFVEPDISKANAVIKIDAIRKLQAEIARAPITSDRHVVLIDRADTMNEAAQNALLKTLEEPIGQVNFILVSSVKSKLLQTIRSRCTPINFAPLDSKDIEKILLKIGMNKVEAENFSSLGDGSVGHAVEIKKICDESKIDIRADVLEFLKDLPSLKNELPLFDRGKSMSENFAENKTQFITTWLFCMKMLLTDLLFFDSREPIYFSDFTIQLDSLRDKYSNEKLFTLLKITTETHRRILSSNVNLRLAIENFLLRSYMFKNYS